VPLIIGTTGDDLPAEPPSDRAHRWPSGLTPGGRRAHDPGASFPRTSRVLIAVDLAMHEPARFVARQMSDKSPARLIARLRR
jgi:hypothetical protein